MDLGRLPPINDTILISGLKTNQFLGVDNMSHQRGFYGETYRAAGRVMASSHARPKASISTRERVGIRRLCAKRNAYDVRCRRRARCERAKRVSHVTRLNIGLAQNRRSRAPVPKNSRVTAGIARLRIRAATAGTYPFELGFSDIATVFLNGRPIFRGDGTFTTDRPRREGLIGYDQARLYLPLVAGDNDLSILVSDIFGGWGIMGRFLGARGLTLEAR